MENTADIPCLYEFIKDELKYIRLFDNPEYWRKIPLLNHIPVHSLEDLSMVRFRGMIQDMLDPEIYLEQYEVISNRSHGCSRFQNGKYRDCLAIQSNESVNFDCKENVQSERRTMFVVSLPAVNDWATSFEKSTGSKPQCAASLNVESHKVAKRPITMEYDLQKTNVKHNVDKRICIENPSVADPSVNSSSLSVKYLLNSPIPDRPGKACMIKLYKDFDNHTLNSVVDVVGFLSIDPALDASTIDYTYDEFQNCSEVQAQNPPPSLIPRIHAIILRKLKHNNPLLDPMICEITAPFVHFESVYNDLKILFTQCLMGDELAANYLLMHLISTVYTRSDSHNIGKFVLNICNLPQEILPNYTRELYNIFELFLPASHYLPMTLEVMNTIQFFPKKDYETNKLTAGILQLAPHTHLVLDETRLQPGMLEATGVRGMQNLEHFLKYQQIRCNFRYYDIDFNADVPVLVLSEGRSMLPNDFLVPLNPEAGCIEHISETIKAAKHYAQPKLDSIRRYFTSAKIRNFGMSSVDSEMIQTDFVAMRKINEKVGVDDLHNLLVLSRLLAVASGKSTLDRECWERAKGMEVLRAIRVQNMPKSNKKY